MILMEKQKKPYPIKYLWHWYFGNYCVKKCRNGEDIETSHECWEKMEEFCDKNDDLNMTHGEFIEFFTQYMNVCRFDEKERRRIPTWKEVVLKEGECPVCKKFGIP